MKWFDGSPWLLPWGEDYFTSLASSGDHEQAARAKGKQLRTRAVKDDDEGIVIQAHKDARFKAIPKL
jgi:hypothetical protein